MSDKDKIKIIAFSTAGLIVFFVFIYILSFIIPLIYPFFREVVLYIMGIIFELYKSVFSAHPLISMTVVATLFAAKRYRLVNFHYWILVIVAPIIAAFIGELAYGGISINISITDAGLLLASITGIFFFYYLFVRDKASNIPGDPVVSKILNHSFIIVLSLMGGAFGIILIDKLLPLIKNYRS